MVKRLVIDDMRWFLFPDEDTTYARSVDDAAPLLMLDEWDECWLDNDMGMMPGGDVSVLVKEIEAAAGENGLLVKVGKFYCHSMNGYERDRMVQALSPFYDVVAVLPDDFMDYERMYGEGKD